MTEVVAQNIFWLNDKTPNVRQTQKRDLLLLYKRLVIAMLCRAASKPPVRSLFPFSYGSSACRRCAVVDYSRPALSIVQIVFEALFRRRTFG